MHTIKLYNTQSRLRNLSINKKSIKYGFFIKINKWFSPSPGYVTHILQDALKPSHLRLQGRIQPQYTATQIQGI